MVITLPRFLPERFALNFLNCKADWILKKLAYFRVKKTSVNFHPKLRSSKLDYKKQKNAALALAKERLEYYNQFYGFNYRKISIRNQKTRWGSCSRNGNLSFNYKIIYLPQNLSDYIIVHELCHLSQFNHSRAFWDLVGKTIQNCKKARKEVRQF
jgi:hypothetical protein